MSAITRSNRFSLAVLLAALGLVMLPVSAFAACGKGDRLTIASSRLPLVQVCEDAVVRDALPQTLFGFNVMHYWFERDIWDASEGAVPDAVIASLREFPGALYRYPGGLVANRFDWRGSAGPLADRPNRKSVEWDFPAPIGFGVDEYLDFVTEVDGQPWFVLNLVGWDDKEMYSEYDSAAIAEANAWLAAHVKSRLGDTVPRYYQLGNELDRADYQWPHDKYVQRARDTIAAMQEIDPDARFVAFLREFNWTYKGAAAERGESRYTDFIDDVLIGLPMVNDFSMHFYYDAPDSDKVFQKIPWRLRQFRSAIDQATRVRAGRKLNVWITEHARGIQFGQIKARDARPLTSNLAAAISTADFLIALAQMPEVQGASWHGLNAMPWELFDPEQGLQPNPVYWAMRLLRAADTGEVLSTYTSSPNLSKYGGGYDHRAVTFLREDGSLALWVINRSTAATTMSLLLEGRAGQNVAIGHRFLAGTAGVNPDRADLQPKIQLDPVLSRGQFNRAGMLQLELPPSSVSVFELREGNL